MISWVYALGLGGKKTLPVLRTTDGVVNDSGDIMRWADPTLYPTDDALDRELAGEYGDCTRRVAYSWFFGDLDRFSRFNVGRTPHYERLLLRSAMPLGKRLLRRYLSVNDDAVARAHDVVTRMLDRIAALLADGRPFLHGDRFSAVDLTFATMTAPVIAPERYGVLLPAVDELAPDAASVVRSVRAHAAGAYAMRLYAGRPKVAAQYDR